MAGLGGKNWSFQEEVTSSDVNGYLADQVVMRFADAATRTAGFGGAGEPTLTEGMVSYLDDVNRMDVYDGSAWVNVATGTINPIGLELIKTQTVGTAVSSVTMSNVFSANFDTYKITMNYVVSSATDPGIFATLGSTTTGYYGATSYDAYSAAASGVAKRNNGAEWNFGYFGANQTSGSWDIFSPFKTNRTAFTGQSSGDLYITTSGGWIADNTSYTSITFAPGSGTLTGGTIRVYGYRNL